MMWWKNLPKRIKDIDRQNGIFKWLLNINATLPPWSDLQKATMCDYGYYYHSSLKTISSPIGQDIFENEEHEAVAYYIWNVYELKWKSYWDALNTPYDILATDHKTTKTDDDKKQIILNILKSKEFENIVRDIVKSSSDNKEYINSENETFKNNDNEQRDNNIAYSKTHINEAETNKSTDNHKTENDIKSGENDDSQIRTSINTVENNEFLDENIYGFNSYLPSDSDDTHTTNNSKTSDSGSENKKHRYSDNTTNNSDENSNEISSNNSTDNENSNESLREINQKISNSSKNTDTTIIENNNENGSSNEKVGKDNNIDENRTTDDTSFRDILMKEHGRIGTSPQSLIEEELELRKKIFLDIVYGDIDRLITIQVY